MTDVCPGCFHAPHPAYACPAYVLSGGRRGMAQQCGCTTHTEEEK